MRSFFVVLAKVALAPCATTNPMSQTGGVVPVHVPVSGKTMESTAADAARRVAENYRILE
jgi:hypothetical protein